MDDFGGDDDWPGNAEAPDRRAANGKGKSDGEYGESGKDIDGRQTEVDLVDAEWLTTLRTEY